MSIPGVRVIKASVLKAQTPKNSLNQSFDLFATEEDQLTSIVSCHDLSSIVCGRLHHPADDDELVQHVEPKRSQPSEIKTSLPTKDNAPNNSAFGSEH